MQSNAASLDFYTLLEAAVAQVVGRVGCPLIGRLVV